MREVRSVPSWRQAAVRHGGRTLQPAALEQPTSGPLVATGKLTVAASGSCLPTTASHNRAGERADRARGAPTAMNREAFLAAICEAPEDDAPRLVYADWLDDNG